MSVLRRILFAIAVISGFALGAQPNLFGVLQDGGPNGYGTIIKIDAATQDLQVKHAFNNTDGASPYGTLLYANDGMYYGTTSEGGSLGNGTLFRYDPVGEQFTTLYHFDQFLTGTANFGQLTQLANGDIVGVCNSGGIYNLGTIWKYDINANLVTKLADLDNLTGGYPFTGIMQASNGKLYGVTTFSGAGNLGTLYEFDPGTSTLTVKKAFSLSTGGYGFSQLVEVNQQLFGVTYFGGPGGAGTIFRFDLNSSVFSTVYNFSYGPNGGSPYSGELELASNGLLYGTTSVGGQEQKGTLFSFDPATSNYTKLYDFTVAQGPSYSPVIEASDGNLYGMTYQGFANNVFDYGSIFRFNPSLNTLTTLKNFDNSSGGTPTWNGLAEYQQSQPLDCSPNGINGGSIAFSGSYNPTTTNIISSTTPASPVSGNANVEYIWLKSAVNVPNTVGNPYWTVVEGSMNQVELELGSMIATTYFIRCARLEGCDMYWGETNIVQVPVDLCSPNYIHGGTIGFEGSYNPNETNIVQSIQAGSSDFGPNINIEYVWLQSPVNVPNTVGNPYWKLVPGSQNQLSLTVTGLTSTTYFIRCARAETCTKYWGETNIVQVPVDLCSPNYIHGGSIGFEGSYNPNETNIVQSIQAGSSDFGPNVNIEYVWLQSPVNVPNTVGNPYWKLVPGSQNQLSLTIIGLTSTTYFIRCARAETCTKYWGETNIVGVPVDLCEPDFIHGGEITYNGPYNPSSQNVITNVVSATSDFGDDLNIEYIWLSNDEDLPYDNGNNGWEIIQGSTNTSYSLGVLTATTYFIRIARVDGCDSYEGQSNIVEVVVDKCLPDFINGGIIGFNGPFNPNETNTITNVESASSEFGNDLNVEYIWLSNDENLPYENGGNGWEIKGGSTGASHTLGALTETTYFIRVARVEGCDIYFGESNIVEVFIDKCLPAFFDAGQIAFDGPYNPNNTNVITNKVSATSDFGDDVNVVYSWYVNHEGNGADGWELIEGAGNASYTLPIITSSAYYLRKAKVAGCAEAMGLSNTVFVEVNSCIADNIDAGKIALKDDDGDRHGDDEEHKGNHKRDDDDDFHHGNNINPFKIISITNATSPYGEVEYAWAKSTKKTAPIIIGGGYWTLIPEATSEILYVEDIKRKTYYVRLAKLPSCDEFVGISNIVPVTPRSTDNNRGGSDNDKDKGEKFKCYPNPSIAGRTTNLEFDNDDSSEMEVRIYNVNGTQSKYQKYDLEKGRKNVVSFSLEGLTSGLYYMEIKKGNKKEMKRLMVR